jgi:hypothetical protein
MKLYAFTIYHVHKMFVRPGSAKYGAIFRIAYVTQSHLDGCNIDSRQVTGSGKVIFN